MTAPDTTEQEPTVAEYTAGIGLRATTADELPPGWLTAEEAAWLSAHARGRFVLEIGSFLGRSTVAMAQGARKVYAIDHHTGSSEHEPGMYAHVRGLGTQYRHTDTLPHFMAEIESRGLREIVTPVVGDAGEALPLFRDGSFGLVFVDGSHDTESVARDAREAFRLADKPGGIVAFHDRQMDSVSDGMTVALNAKEPDRDVLATRWQRIEAAGSIAAFVRGDFSLT